MIPCVELFSCPTYIGTQNFTVLNGVMLLEREPLIASDTICDIEHPFLAVPSFNGAGGQLLVAFLTPMSDLFREFLTPTPRPDPCRRHLDSFVSPTIRAYKFSAPLDQLIC